VRPRRRLNPDRIAGAWGTPGTVSARAGILPWPGRLGGAAGEAQRGRVRVRYEVVAEAYRDLERSTARLELIGRLAELFKQTPSSLLPVVAMLCQGQIAPDFTGVEIGIAERMAARAVAQALGVPAEEALAGARETGDLALVAERLVERTAGSRPANLEVKVVFDTLHEIAAAEGAGSQGRKLAGLVGLLSQATPLEARYLIRTTTGQLRLGIGTATILDALAEVHAGGRKARPVLERAYNVCSDLGLVTSTLVAGGLAAVEAMQVRAGNPVRPMLAQRLSSSAEILAKLGGSCAAEYKYDGMRVQAHRTADGGLELYTRRLERVAEQFPDVIELLDEGLGPREAILEGEVVAADPVSGDLRPFQEVMFRRRKHGIAEAVVDVPVSLFCFDLLYADGEDLTRLPYLERRARLEQAVTLSPRLRLATAEQVGDEAGLEAVFEQAIADGCEGLLCKSLAPTAGYQAGARGWLWIKLKRDYRTELSDTLDLAVVGALYGRGRRAGVYGALLLAAYDPATDTFQTVCKCGTGFSDAELAALPERLAPLVRPEPPARVDVRRSADVWFEPGMVVEVLGAELTASPKHTAAWGKVKDDSGLALRFPRFTGRYRDDKAPEDATTVDEILQMWRTAQRAGAG
jgi:DNA ligase 1